MAINTCSTYKPSATNPCSLSEWYSYNHGQSCVAAEFGVVQCDILGDTCNATFSASSASTSVTMVPANGISPDGDGLNDVWIIDNANKFPNARFVVVDYQSSNIVWDFTGTYTPWNAVGNTGSYNGVKVPSNALYFFRIFYNDGTGREIGVNTITTANTLSILYPSNGDIVTRNFASSTVSSAAACAATNWEAFTFTWPITTAGGLWPSGGEAGPYVTGRAGYYRLQGTAGNWVQINSTGYIISRGTC